MSRAQPALAPVWSSICRIDFRLMYGITLGAGGELRAIAAFQEVMGIGCAIELGADLVGPTVVAAVELRALEP